MVAAVETMAYAGELPWHGLGTKVPQDLSTDEFIKQFQNNKLFEMRVKSNLMKEFYKTLSPYGKSQREINYIIESFWTVIDNLYPQLDMKIKEIRPFIVEDFEMSQKEEVVITELTTNTEETN